MSKSKITIWDRAFELSVVYECYAGEEVLESQREAFALLEDNAAEVAESLKAVKKYVRKTGAGQLADDAIENIFKYVMPKSIFVPHSKKHRMTGFRLYKAFFHQIVDGIHIPKQQPTCKHTGTDAGCWDKRHASHNFLFVTGKLIQRKQCMDMVIISCLAALTVLGNADFIISIQGCFFFLKLFQQSQRFQNPRFKQSCCQFYRQSMTVNRINDLFQNTLVFFCVREEATGKE